MSVNHYVETYGLGDPIGKTQERLGPHEIAVGVCDSPFYQDLTYALCYASINPQRFLDLRGSSTLAMSRRVSPYARK